MTNLNIADHLPYQSPKKSGMGLRLMLSKEYKKERENEV
jgi:hypothetical protein